MVVQVSPTGSSVRQLSLLLLLLRTLRLTCLESEKLHSCCERPSLDQQFVLRSCCSKHESPCRVQIACVFQVNRQRVHHSIRAVFAASMPEVALQSSTFGLVLDVYPHEAIVPPCSKTHRQRLAYEKLQLQLMDIFREHGRGFLTPRAACRAVNEKLADGLLMLAMLPVPYTDRLWLTSLTHTHQSGCLHCPRRQGDAKKTIKTTPYPPFQL